MLTPHDEQRTSKSPIRDSFHRCLPWILPVLFLAIWFISSGFIPAYLFPPPAAVGKAAYVYFLRAPGEAPYAGRFLSDATASLIRVGLGFALAVLLGRIDMIVLGIMIIAIMGRASDLFLGFFLKICFKSARRFP